MNEATHDDIEEALTLAGRRQTLLIRTPARLAEDPALIVCLQSDRRRCFSEPAYQPLIDAPLAAGYRVASFDLPNHGDRVDAHGEGLTGMAAAVADGVDVFAEVVEMGRAVVDRAIERGWARAGRIGLAGVSRGAICALNWCAEDARVGAVAAFAPVTDLPTLREFAELADSPIVQRRNALALVARLAGRPIFLTIGRRDPRVGTERCREFSEALRAAAPDRAPPVFDLTEGETHALPATAYRRGADWLVPGMTRSSWL